MTNLSKNKKTLVVIGSGADMVTGNLIYMLGGIGLQTFDELHQKSIGSYEKAVQGLKGRKELYFYTPRHRVTVESFTKLLTWCEDQISPADSLLLVVKPPFWDADALLAGDLVNNIKALKSFFVKGKAIILIEALANHGWSEEQYNDLVQSIEAVLRSLHISVESIPLIPSDLHSENFIEPSLKTPCYNNVTLVTALDEIL